MFLILLLQAASTTETHTVRITDLTNVYIALGGTLVAALVSLIASLVASKRAEKAAQLAAATSEKIGLLSVKTTKEVADLSQKTTQEVATLSATVLRESATLAARTAQEIKDKDYTHEFYKRIMEKRLKAWEKSEEIITSISATRIGLVDGKKYYDYFSSAEKFDKAINLISHSIANQIIWMGGGYGEALTNFHGLLADIHKQFLDKCRSSEGSSKDDIIKELGKENNPTCATLFRALYTELAKEIKDLPNVERFVDILANVSYEDK